jgi:hypothetical protein
VVGNQERDEDEANAKSVPAISLVPEIAGHAAQEARLRRSLS